MSVGRVLIEKNVAVPMRDGVLTYGDLYRPAEGPAVPALVSRSPYDKERSLAQPLFPQAQKLAERGYAVLIVDTRGRFSSEGRFEPFHSDAEDGYDTVEWAASQPWCDGNVGIYGPSYLGATTLLAARERPPSLRCAIPIITADDYYDGWTYRGGALELGFTGTWGIGLAVAQLDRADAGVAPEDAAQLMVAATGGLEALSTRPLTALPGKAAENENVAAFWADWLAHDRRDDYWESLRHSRDYSRFEVPMLHVGGWFDIFAQGTVRNFLGMSQAQRAQQHLWMGPWAHSSYDRWLGEMEFGPVGAAGFCGIDVVYNEFLDHHLKGAAVEHPAVHYFLMGANEWRDAETWPPPEAAERALYLHSEGRANSASGDGVLAERPPAGSERPDRYLYDPLRPVPTEGGPLLQVSVGLPGPRDQRRVEARDDVLCYTTERLPAPLDVAGPVTVELWAVTDCPDTDWTAKLVDVYPDGRALSLTDGVIRARFAESLAEPRPLVAGEPTRYTLDLANTAHRFGAGHRVRLEISSSNFPRFDANTNTGGANAQETDARLAVQHVLHDAEHRSAVRIWVLPS